jgi:hypothetical protein
VNSRKRILWKNSSEDNESASFVLEATSGFRGLGVANDFRFVILFKIASASFSDKDVAMKTRDAERKAAAL